MDLEDCRICGGDGVDPHTFGHCRNCDGIGMVEIICLEDEDE